MNKFDASIGCPVCRGPLSPRVLACDGCGIRVDGPFALNEFAGLDAKLLHFLRIFVHCDGRIKDMEKALGVSYPTVKATMTQLKRALRMPDADHTAPVQAADPGSDKQQTWPTGPISPAGSGDEPMAILDAVGRGDLDFAAALSLLRAAAPPPAVKLTQKPPTKPPK